MKHAFLLPSGSVAVIEFCHPCPIRYDHPKVEELREARETPQRWEAVNAVELPNHLTAPPQLISISVIEDKKPKGRFQVLHGADFHAIQKEVEALPIQEYNTEETRQIFMEVAFPPMI